MRIIAEPFSGVIVLQPKRIHDERGFFIESYEKERYKRIGINETFVQDNHSRSKKNVLRGMHFTKKTPQSQLLTIMSGKIYDVVVDIRKDSNTFGEWYGTELSSDGVNQIYMMHGFAHGFCVLSDIADLHYKMSHCYDPLDDAGLYWNDTKIGIKWPIKSPLVSKKDHKNPKLESI